MTLLGKEKARTVANVEPQWGFTNPWALEFGLREAFAEAEGNLDRARREGDRASTAANSAAAASRKGSSSPGSTRKPITDPADIERLLGSKRGGVLVEGYYPNGTRAYYGLGL
jgi:hypothetical protein